MPRVSAATTEPPSPFSLPTTPSPANPVMPDMAAYDLELKKRLTRIAQDPAEMNKYLSDVTTMLRIYRERNKVSELYPDEMTAIFGRALENRIGDPMTKDDTTQQKTMLMQKNLRFFRRICG